MKPILVFLFFLTSTVAGYVSTTHELSRYWENSSSIFAFDGSKIYLASPDKALALSKITLTTKGQSITLDKLLTRFDADGYQDGWPVHSDLKITTTNSKNVTLALKGNLFLATPTMAQDPNFLVLVVRGAKRIERTTNDNTTLVLLNIHVENDGSPVYKGFTHTRILDISQPKTTSLYFYHNVPDDNYVDLNNSETLKKRIFANPLQVFSTGDPSHDNVFFDNIDPIQYSLSVWYVRSVGGIQFDVMSDYVDTTNISASSSTVTGLANSQLFTYNSSVSFPSAGDDLGTSGFFITTELFGRSNLTVVVNGQNSQSEPFVITTSDLTSSLQVQNFTAISLNIYPASNLVGNYFIQYFNLDNGPAVTSSVSSSQASTSTPSVTSSQSSQSVVSSTTTSATSSTTIPTTTSTSTTPKVISTFLSSLLIIFALN